MKNTDYTAKSGKQRREMLNKCLATWGYKCFICGLPIKKGEESLQHIIPRSKGGRDTEDNLRPAHLKCNSSLGDREMKGYAGEVHDGLSFFLS